MPHTRNNPSVPETAQYTPSLVKDQYGNFHLSDTGIDMLMITNTDMIQFTSNRYRYKANKGGHK